MNKISIAVGSVLIIVALGLSFLSFAKSKTIAENQKKICSNYLHEADSALKVKDFKKAIKYVKMAIEVDPKNKLAFATYEKILEAKIAPKVVNNSITETTNKPATSTPPQNGAKKPVFEEEDEEGMGC